MYEGGGAYPITEDQAPYAMLISDRVTISEKQAALPAAADLRATLQRTITYLTTAQRDGNHWVGVLSSSALATALSITALHVVDRQRYAAQIQRGRAWLFATQAANGGWGDAVVDPSNINATSLAIGALTLTAPTASADPAESDLAEVEALRRAWVCLERFGGLDAVGDPSRCTLSGPARTIAAMAGLMDWHRIKRLRPEVVLLPTRLRRTISTTFPAYLSISMLHSKMVPHPLNQLPTYERACRAVLAWLAAAQGPNGSFEESAFLTSVIISTLTFAGYGELPWLPAAINFVVTSQREDGGWPIDRDLETFDTDMTTFALTAAGEPVPHAEAVCDWLLSRQFQTVCMPTSAKPGGWAWAMPAGWPDGDDTSYTLMALRLLGVPTAHAAIRAGGRWLEDMQNSDGSWSTFVRNSRMPFDHDCPYITGHVLSALHATGHLDLHPRILNRALAYLRRAQRYDGSFASIWFREVTAGTASVLEALADCGLLEAEAEMAARARDALLRSQNDDGGWGGLRLQTSTAEETSWAMLALLRFPHDARITHAIKRAVAWLVSHQRPDGTWECAPIGLYYSAMWYSDTYYAVTLPAQALARARVLYDERA